MPVTSAELERLKKRFMKLDRYDSPPPPRREFQKDYDVRVNAFVASDGSGSIDREEFLQIPQIASNPLASRMIAIFDEECVLHFPLILTLFSLV